MSKNIHLDAPTGPIPEQRIELNDEQNEMVNRYHVERAENITRQWVQISRQSISESERDVLLSQSVLEVEALVSYAIEGGFARDFVYINNELYRVYQSIQNFIRDPALRNIQWAEMTAHLITTNWQSFVKFVQLHEQDFRELAGHVVNVYRTIHGALEKIIPMLQATMKKLLVDSLEFVKRYALPTTIVALSLTAGISIPAVGHFALCLPAYAAFGYVAVGIAATLGVQKGLGMLKKEKEVERTQNIAIEKVGLKKARDCIQRLEREIVKRKCWEEDEGRSPRPYIPYERKISNFKEQIEDRFCKIE